MPFSWPPCERDTQNLERENRQNLERETPKHAQQRRSRHPRVFSPPFPIGSVSYLDPNRSSTSPISPMAEHFSSYDRNSETAGDLSSLSGSELLDRLFPTKIEFHLARLPASVIGCGDGDFKIETLNPSPDLGYVQRPVGVGTRGEGKVVEKRSEVGEHREHWLDPDISFSMTYRRIGAGLANLGNTCFLNSVLQCLTYTEPFAAYLQSGKHKSSCHTAGFCAMCALQNHVMTALQSSGKILSPSHLVKNLQCISRRFQRSRQEDAHEYMVNLLESMHKCCLPSGVPSESAGAYEKSLVHKIFGGKLRSQVRCMECKYSSDTFDPFLDLSLEINKANTLCKALSHFTAVEQLDGGDRQYQCQRCKHKVRADKQLTVHKAPYVLTVHLKRFSSHVPGQKIDRKVEFEPTLDLNPFVSDPQEGNMKYTLYGVLVHHGWSTHSGHYYCYVRTSSGLWHSLNDNQVSQVSEKVVLAQKAYMLFYIRNRNSAPKRSNAIGKENNLPKTFGNKGAIFSSTDTKANHNGQVDKSFSSLQQSLVSAKLENKVVPMEVFPPETTTMRSSFFVKGDHNLTIGSLSQSNGHKEKELGHLPKSSFSKDCSSEYDALKEAGNHATDSSTDSDTSSKENRCRMMVEKLVISLSHSNSDTSAFSNDTDKRNDASTDVAKKNQCCGHSNHVSNNLPLQKDDGSLGKSANNLASIRTEESKLMKHFNSVDGSLSELPLSTVAAPKALLIQDSDILQGCQREIVCENVRDTTKNGTLKSASDSVPKEEGITVTHTQSSSLVGDGAAAMSKGSKCSHRKSVLLGPKHLFVASLSSWKKKKLKHKRKKCLNQKDHLKSKAIETAITDDKDTSTSEIVNILNKQQTHTAEKSFRSSSKKERLQSKTFVCAENGLADGHISVRNIQDNTVLANPEEHVIGLKKNPIQTDVRGINLRAKGSSQNDIMSMLTRGLGDATVPKWDEGERLSSFHQSTNPPVSIGYVLDEWDEEYDRGKRKKVKKSNQFSSLTNPFEEIAQQNSEERMKRMKFDHRSSGNQPFRI